MKIDKDLEPLTVYNYEASPRLDTFIRHVLERIPDSYTEEFPSFSVLEARSPWGAHVDDDGTIFCDPKLVNELVPDDVIVGTLAHEFAHVFLEHPGEGGLEDEYEADRLASEWGFVAEIKALRQQVGPPTEG